VEAALIGTPFVIIYRVSRLTWTLGRRFVKLDRFGMPNLIAGRDVVPEFVQHAFRPAAVADKIRELVADGPVRQAMLEGLAGVRAKLRPHGAETGAERAAKAVLDTIKTSL
jgi:lipid-A-disaccharide synthase